MEILSDPMPDMLAMPRFDDGVIVMQELLRRLAEQVVNAVMDAEADQLCGGGANSRNGFRERSLATCVDTLTPRHPQAAFRQLLPGGRARSCPRRRDARRWHEHPQGAEGGLEDRRIQALEGPDECYRLESWTQTSRICAEGRSTARRCPTTGSTRPTSSAAARGASPQSPWVPRGSAARSTSMRDCIREAGSCQLRRRVGRIVSQVFRGRDAAAAAAMYHAACDMLARCCPRAAAVLEKAEPDALAYLDFPPTHWKHLRTNNMQERTNREIKRRTRVVRVFPSTGSLVRLAGAVM